MNPQFFPHSVFFTLAQTSLFCPGFVGNQPSKSLWSPFPALTLLGTGNRDLTGANLPQNDPKARFYIKKGLWGGVPK